MRRASASGLLVCAALGLFGCGKGAGGGDRLASGAGPEILSISPVQWDATDGGVGQVQAVTENAEQVYVFGDSGAQVFAGGAPLSSDATVTAWNGAATIPAADGNGNWAVGLDKDGKLWRVRATGVLEPISGRYGLDREAVLDLVAMGAGYTAFALGSSIAISDGTNVTRYDVPADALAGGAGLVAWADKAGLVRRFDPVKGTLEGWKLPGARLVAVSSLGRVAAATDRGLYYESGTLNLNLVYTAAPGATITALSAAGARFWFTAGGRIGLLDRGQVQRTSNAPLAADAQLTGSPSGDVWAVTAGELHRFADSGAGDFATWQQTVLPVFARVCSSCHLPTGTAGVNLASYKAWKDKRALIYKRVIDASPSAMPPAGAGVTLSEVDKAAIKAWAGPLG